MGRDERYDGLTVFGDQMRFVGVFHSGEKLTKMVAGSRGRRYAGIR